MSDPRITDAVTMEALRASEGARMQRGLSRLEAMRAALEAAVPLLAPQPVVDREAALQKLLSYCHVQADEDGDATEDVQLAYDDVAVQLTALLNEPAPRPVVDREALFNVMDAALPVHVHADDRDRAIDAVLALLNGGA